MRVRIHPAGGLMWLAGFLFIPSQLILAAVFALLWHEAAHVAAIVLCGVRDFSIEITPFGGMADIREYERMPAMKQAICAFSGVAGSAIGAVFCFLVSDALFWKSSGQFHLSLALFNCLPVWPLDGARTIVAFSRIWGMQSSVKKVLSFLAILLGLCMTILGLYGAWKGEINLSLLFSGPYLCYAAQQGRYTDKMRSICFAKRKLKDNAVMPVQIYAASAFCPQMAGRLSPDKYHLFLQIGLEGIQQVWTEDELLQQCLKTEGIGKSCK